MLKKTLKRISITLMAMVMLLAMPVVDVGASNEQVTEQAYMEIMPMAQVRIRPTGARGYSCHNRISSLWITGGPVVSVVATRGNLVQVSGGGLAHMRWFLVTDVGIW